MLFGRAPGHARVNDEQPVVDDAELVEILGRWKSAGGPQPEVAALVPVDTAPIQRDLPPLAVRTFDRDVDIASTVDVEHCIAHRASCSTHAASMRSSSTLPVLARLASAAATW